MRDPLIMLEDFEKLDRLFEMYERARRVSNLQQRGPVIDAAQFAELHITAMIESSHFQIDAEIAEIEDVPRGERGIQG